MYHVKTYNKISKKGLDRLDKTKIQVSDSTDKPDAIILRSHALKEETLPESLYAIGRAGAGVNNVQVSECTQKGIVVFNTPGANANAVKELLFASLLLGARNILPGLEFVKSLAGKGDAIPDLVEKEKAKFKGYELRDRTLGVIGLGAIGMLVANEASELGMKVIGFDPFLSVHNAWRLSRNVKPAESLKQLLQQSDFVTLHMPLTDQTRNLINDENIDQFRKGAVLLNFARDLIVDEDVVLDALDAGKLSLYLCDFPTEKTVTNPKVIATPHLGASTDEAEENCAIMVADQIQDYLLNGNITNSVNFPNSSLERSGLVRLTIIHKNIPNMVGQITKVLADQSINISEMMNKGRGELAYTIVDLDQNIKDNTLSELSAIEGIIRLRCIN
jgi:D-3-phosphoglycerate dehydrogenase